MNYMYYFTIVNTLMNCIVCTIICGSRVNKVIQVIQDCIC